MSAAAPARSPGTLRRYRTLSRLPWCVGAACLAMILFFPDIARAQASLSGSVVDATGSILPGVVVETSSPALIEKVRSAVTDGAGRYTIVNLPPGTYTVTFALSGFTTVRREDIVLRGASATQVNVELRVGAVEETLTVTGQAPVVDVQSTRQQTVINHEMLDSLPGTRSLTARLDLLPGVSSSSIHGSSSSDTHSFNDGVRTDMMYGAGVGVLGPTMNEAATAELTYDTAAQSAELQTGGIRMNAIPREGGNVFAGTLYGIAASSGLVSDNRTPELRATIRDPNRLAYNYEVNPAFGGPVVKDKLWFFAGGRASTSKTFVAGIYFPDGQQAYTKQPLNRNHSELLRLTYQASQRNKVRASVEKADVFVKYGSVGNLRPDPPAFPATQPEASFDIKIPHGLHTSLKWTSTVSNRLLVEGRIASQSAHWMHVYQPGTGPLDIPHNEITTGALTGRGAAQRRDEPSNRVYSDGSVSYVTGSHAFKAGLVQVWGWLEHQAIPNGDTVSLNFFNGLPNSITVMNAPVHVRQEMHRDLGVYAQDTWTLQRFTFNLGARWDSYSGGLPRQLAPAGRFVPARDFAAVPELVDWNDGSLRLGVAYDLFGNGKTAIKGNVSKYVAGESTQLISLVNPMQIQFEQRSWQDLNGDGTILNPDGSAQYAEIGPTRNTNFGLNIGLRVDPDIARGHNWDQSLSLQHELWTGVAVTAGYYHRTFYNLQWTHNLFLDPDRDYIPFTVAVPQDSRLPNGGGEVITMYNLAPAKLGQVDNVIEVSPSNTRVYHGFEAVVNARLKNGFILSGVTVQRTSTNSCSVNDPNQRRFCDNEPPYRTLFKLSAMHRLPYDLQLSGNVALRPGLGIGATYNVNSVLAGVPLTGGGTLAVQLIEPNSRFYDYQKQVDLRIDRTFRFGARRLKAFADIYNVFNLSTVTSVLQVYGPNWLRPNTIVQARFLRLGTQIDF